MIASVLSTLSTICSKRKPQVLSEPARKHTAVCRSFTGGKDASKPLYVSDDLDNISTDVGDHSTDFIATSGSDTEAPPLKTMPSLNSQFQTSGTDTDVITFVYQRNHRPPPGLAPPPGLDAPPGLPAYYGHSNMPRNSHLNSQAPVFVPHSAATEGQNTSQQLRQSVRHLKATLQDLESNVGRPTPNGEDKSLAALQDALSKLTPQDAAKVRGFLAAKEAAEQETTSRRMASNLPLNELVPPPGQLYPVPLTNAPEATGFGRPFTPFGAQPPRAFVGQQGRMPQTRTEPAAEDSSDTLRTNLKDLSEMDSGRVLMVRKINRLGSDSAAAIEDYFAKFGTVDRCMVTHSRSRPTAHGPARLRPAAVGFLVMSEPEAVQAALNHHGGEHIVRGVTINVAPFKSHPIGVKD